MRKARSGIFDDKFTVQTFKYLLACFIPPRKVLLHIILYIHFRHVDLKQHFIQYYCPCTCARSGIFDHKFTVQTFKYLLACFIPPRKVLLHIILYIHLHAFVCRLKAAFHTILLSLYLCVQLETNFRPTIYGPNIQILACMFHSTRESPVAYYFIYTLACLGVSS